MNEERIIEWFEYIAQLATDRKKNSLRICNGGFRRT